MSEYSVRDAGLVVLRVGVGGALFAHGVRKLVGWFGWFGGGGRNGTAAITSQLI